MTVRVRFAPSPTGHLHIGSVRTALFNFLFARHHGGQFILRLEDTDTNRNVEGADIQFLDGFRWLGIKWDEGFDVGGPYTPYRCMERLDIYRQYIDRLLREGKAYPCFCTDDDLAAERNQAEREGRIPRYSGRCRHLPEALRESRMASGEPYSIRFIVEPGRELVVHDLIRGDVSFQSDDIGDFVIVKSNGIPTYNFQVVIDDIEMHITHVIRAEEHLSNTPRQLLVYEAFGATPPAFAHLPIVLDEQRKKLSKRDPNVLPIATYQSLGYLPEAFINFLALLGWSPGGEQELFTVDELCRLFDLDRVGKSGAVFDVEKLNWMANQYFKALPVAQAARMVREQLDRAGIGLPAHADDTWLEEVVSLYQDGMRCAHDFIEMSKTFFTRQVEWEDDAIVLLRDPTARSVVEAYLAHCREAGEAWTAEASRERFKRVQADLGVKGRQLFMPVRAALTGQLHGPDLQKTIALLSQKVVIERLSAALAG
ncbi:glutamyl-tRNA synthetase [Alicyclobacillus hesperidum URH17-3-68]|uniref:Glutamate--tRNA ligase n=1 Tax=Alicyclobacillus hesperidum TaxID=89784 RepID=A0A1H2VHN6_9BACL|nr:glutamate--tRNA ligase [Alicyclobacillus hesperidum]EJY56833.1 glutamyl-tRNA synthetase [Alicyclobacillus hesperidum URH17-3-68]GLG02574.1 glutamate--tRNA ligase [Alicyclobacillus hesperidum subsp. aegles]GLV12901.1 glutamate--tRNA ligase [Alicyclobacillus hesperidum]SDW67788.1 glutamyl-tRNA synthetase /glutamate--tRNA(Gln) ligase [Alicyclobacillus hesperidum]